MRIREIRGRIRRIRREKSERRIRRIRREKSERRENLVGRENKRREQEEKTTQYAYYSNHQSLHSK